MEFIVESSTWDGALEKLIGRASLHGFTYVMVVADEGRDIYVYDGPTGRRGSTIYKSSHGVITPFADYTKKRMRIVCV